ncbi:unnamed protein product [Plutella xylostella]|uniref:(diamondback moth) hypothetical protein n=1 Tax=Plutella xylostella TaxID=51655 RepID=A0A8S4ESZ5_PLUXY|nr:unnamed protein product [Plutella xylostella]
MYILPTTFSSIDEELLGNDVEVSNLPEENGENATHMIMAVATKLGVTLRESDIVSAERVGARRRAPGEGGDAGAGAAGRPRPLVVRFTRRAVKDELTAAARVRRGAVVSSSTHYFFASHYYYIYFALYLVFMLLIPFVIFMYY